MPDVYSPAKNVEMAVSVVLNSVMSVLENDFKFGKEHKDEFLEAFYRRLSAAKKQAREEIRRGGSMSLTDMRDYGTRFL